MFLHLWAMPWSLPAPVMAPVHPSFHPPFHPPGVPRPQCRCPQSRAFFLLYALVEKKFPPEYFSCYKMLEGVRADQWVVPAPGPGGGGMPTIPSMEVRLTVCRNQFSKLVAISFPRRSASVCASVRPGLHVPINVCACLCLCVYCVEVCAEVGANVKASL